jgi:hypothetical protein
MSLACLADWYANLDDGAVNGLSMPVFEFGGVWIGPLEQIPDPNALESDQSATALELDTAKPFGPIRRICSLIEERGGLLSPLLTRL